jgi:hypothetical protein
MGKTLISVANRPKYCTVDILINQEIMNISFYFPYFIQAIAQNFEYWAVYESRLDEAVIGLLLWQLLEDGISYVIRRFVG